MKTCTKCEVEKPLEDFHKKTANADGRRAACKECVHADYAVRYRRDRVKILERAKVYYQANREKCDARKEKWRRENPERYEKSYAAWVARHPEKIREYKEKHKAKRKREREEPN